MEVASLLNLKVGRRCIFEEVGNVLLITKEEFKSSSSGNALVINLVFYEKASTRYVNSTQNYLPLES